MINYVEKWCKKWLVRVNLEKTKIVHFRKKMCARSELEFKYMQQVEHYIDVYKYLGI